MNHRAKANVCLQAISAGSRLHYEFYEEQEGSEMVGGVRVIDLKRVDRYPESEHEILFQLVKQFNVPEELRCGSNITPCPAPAPHLVFQGSP